MKRPLKLVIVALLLGVIAWFAYDLCTTPPMRSSNDRNAAASLKTVATAQSDYQSNDRDGNGKNDYWRGDIAGLYMVKGKDGQEIKLIEVSIAYADVRPLTEFEKHLSAPKSGYRFRALRFADEKIPDPDRFAAIAFPDTEKSGKAMFIISHENQMFRKKAVPGGVEIYPTDPIKEGWEKMD